MSINFKKGEKEEIVSKLPDKIEDLSPLPSPSKKRTFDFSRSPNKLIKKEIEN